MPVQLGKCPNLGDCSTADARTVITIPPGSEFRCPECTAALRPVENTTVIAPWMIGLALALVLGLAAAGWSIFGGNKHGEAKPSASAQPPTVVDTATPPPVAPTPHPSEPPAAASTPRLILDPSVPVSAAAWSQMLQDIQGPLLDEPITFDPGEKELSEDARRVILDGVQKLPNYSPRIRLLVEAHVDKGTSPLDDQKLSNDRAAAVKQFLTAECRISPDRIFLRPCGSDQPPDRKVGESERAYQRRTRSVWILLVNE